MKSNRNLQIKILKEQKYLKRKFKNFKENLKLKKKFLKEK
jgi:hypothetical protein